MGRILLTSELPCRIFVVVLSKQFLFNGDDLFHSHISFGSNLKHMLFLDQNLNFSVLFFVHNCQCESD